MQNTTQHKKMPIASLEDPKEKYEISRLSMMDTYTSQLWEECSTLLALSEYATLIAPLARPPSSPSLRKTHSLPSESISQKME